MALGGKRFRAVGIAATAEIFAVNRIRDLNEGQDTAELTVRISGPGLDTFDADCEAPKGNVLPQVGDPAHGDGESIRPHLCHRL